MQNISSKNLLIECGKGCIKRGIAGEGNVLSSVVARGGIIRSSSIGRSRGDRTVMSVASTDQKSVSGRMKQLKAEGRYDW